MDLISRITRLGSVRLVFNIAKNVSMQKAANNAKQVMIFLNCITTHALTQTFSYMEGGRICQDGPQISQR